MNIKFDDKAKEAMKALLNNSNEKYIRIKAFRGCGRPAYELYTSFKGDDDKVLEMEGISFVYNVEDENMIDGIEIKYDREVYTNGFYIK